MKTIDINELQANTTLNSDICIVGSGAAGITVATELDGTSHTVSLIESGGYEPDEETQALYDLDIAGHAIRENFMPRARYFGGTCNLWGGRSMRLTPFDLRPREWIPDSGWPLPYEELDRYYPKASRMLKLPVLDISANALIGERMSAAEKYIFENADLEPDVSLWAKRPLRFGEAYRKQLRRSRNITVYLNANVTQIKLNPAGDRVEECTALSLRGKSACFRANYFVLACGGLETARLLLVSRSVHRFGVGNQFDVVGRYYMDHPRAVFGKIRLFSPQKLPLLLGMPLADGRAQVGIQFSAEVQEREQLLNNYLTVERRWSDQAAKAYESFVRSMKISLRRGYAGKRFAFSSVTARVPDLIYFLAPRELVPHALYRAARTLKQKMSKGVTELVMVNYCEQMPNPQSRVYLSDRRDRLNMPRLVLDWRLRPEETRSLMRLQARVDSSLRERQVGYVDNGSAQGADPVYTDASHHIGAARMSSDPRRGVVDGECKVHGVRNLFVAGSAVFPTSGHANPTLTVVALAIRLAEHLRALQR